MKKKEREEKEKLLRALQELERRKRAAPLLFYKPHPKQNEFHEAGKTHRRRIVLSGNRWGKSHAGSREALAHVYGYRYWEVPGISLTPDGDLPSRSNIPTEYWIFRHDKVPIRVPNHGMVVTGLSTLRGIGQVIWPKIKEAVPQALLRSREIKPYMQSSGVPERIEFPNGSVIHTGSKQQDRSQFEGFDIDWAWVDEPVPRWLYNGLWRGLSDNCGPIWFTMTPLGSDSLWMIDWLKDPEVWSYSGPQRDNTYLSSRTFDDFESDGKFSKRERAARLYGEFEFLGDRVFENLDPDVHFIEPFPIPPHWLRGQTVDPHHKKAAFVLWWACDPETEPEWVYHFYREWPTEDYFNMEGGAMSCTDYAALFRSIEVAHPAQVSICDPRFGKAEWAHLGAGVATVWVSEMGAAGLHYDANVHGVGRLEIGHTKITELLRYDKNFPVGPTNTPRIFVHRSCKNLMKAFQYYGYLQQKESERGVVEKVSEEYKDPIDCVRYTVLYRIPMMNVSGWVGEQFSDDELRRENEGY